MEQLNTNLHDYLEEEPDIPLVTGAHAGAHAVPHKPIAKGNMSYQMNTSLMHDSTIMLMQS